MLPLYRDNSLYQGKKNISMICKELVSRVKKTNLGCIFKKLLFSLVLIFFDENNNSKIRYVWGSCSNRFCQVLFNWIQINMVFKSCYSQKFYKIDPLENFLKFKWKQAKSLFNKATVLRFLTLLKKTAVQMFSCGLANFLRTSFLWSTSG